MIEHVAWRSVSEYARYGLRTAAMIPLLSLVAAPSVRGQALDRDRIDAWFDRLADEQGFSGAVLIAKGGRIVLEEGYGLADDERGTPMTPSTVVLTGSISKQFTAAAILRLESDGLLRVTDPISEHLPGVPADKRTITIHHLLTHTAGFTSDHFDHDLTPMSLEEALRAIWALPLGFEPGTRYDYSNTGYALLAAIVQETSGRPFTSYMREEMFEPAGLTATGFFEDDWTGHEVATAYRNGERQGPPSEFPGPFWGNMGNAGVMSTTMDLFRWFHGLESGEILGADGGRKMFAPHAPMPREGRFYGYGWGVGESDFGPAIMHSGLGLGGNSDLAFYRDPDLTIIILCNRAAFRFREGEPYEVWMPAVEARRQLVLNLMADDFGTLPAPTMVPSRSRRRIVLVGLGLLAATLTGVSVHRRRSSHSRRPS